MLLIRQYHKVLLIRTFAYLSVFIGLAALIFQFGPLMISEVNYRKDKILGITHRLDPQIIASTPTTTQNPPTLPSASPEGSTFGDLFDPTATLIKPVSTEYGLVIEKINANAKVIPNVNPAVEKEYTSALSQGVAAAKDSTEPGKPGNLFIFSHSADAPWNISRFNAIFYLLRELEPGDKIIVFYQGKRFDYIVYDKAITKPTDTTFLNNRYDQPVLTLQTCDPPGTLNNRLIVRAKLEGF